ncbi:YcgN family cysteine cluster protein [Roseomonas sp. OT10]|uniref:YcgN family cysteine cluster protein n=1 Tax=Roseomonas cutis TaxID=2897332 RepID=UPI001E5A346C|nr:YcgN family cysteine cluster protein [Roseomonas sp. OT10]UFN47246.1 YcgN family cysteine cluster protein [Roseomonas sp. OT10]
MADETTPFWKRKTLAQMSRAEWESLCDGCGRCCLHKLRDEDTDVLHWTEVGCRLLDTGTGLCRDYANRRSRVPDCVKLTPARLAKIDWLPPTCAYRLVRDGQDLPWWHPLVSGDPGTVRQAGVSVGGRVVSERDAGALEDHVAAWPGRWPEQARARAMRIVRRVAATPEAVPAAAPGAIPGKGKREEAA